MLINKQLNWNGVTKMNNYNGTQVNGLISNAILTTAMLANEVSIQTNGEFLFQEPDYVKLVSNFQLVLSKMIMQPRSQQDLKDAAKKYITEILNQINKDNENDNGNTRINDTNGIIP